MTNAEWAEQRATNRAMWDERVPLHAASDFYDQDAFRAGRDEIRDFEAAEVGDVTGKRLLHLQCHMGQDTLSWARRGAAKVVGLDFSEPALEVARGLAAEAGLGPDRAEFVYSDVYESASAVPEADYDIVSSVAAAGLRLEFLHEHDMTLFQRVTELDEGADGYWRMPEGRPRLPLMFSLKASRS